MVNLVCPLCVTPPFGTVGMLLRHIRITHADSDNFCIQCTLQGCCRTFRSFLSYRTHIYRHHRHSLTQDPCQEEPTVEQEVEETTTGLGVLESTESDDVFLHTSTDSTTCGK